jgi:hypothetical protein
LLFVLFYILFVCKCVLPPGDNPSAVNKYIIISSSPYKNLSSSVKSCMVSALNIMGIQRTGKIVG